MGGQKLRVRAHMPVARRNSLRVVVCSVCRRSFGRFDKRPLQFIGDEARQFLVFSEQQKLISAVEREMIIDRSVALRQEQLALDKLKLIMLMVLWNRHQELDPLLIEELLTPLHSAQLH